MSSARTVPDGAILLRTRVPLGPVARNTGAWLHRWAKDAPDRVLLAERSGQGWRELRYADALQQVRSLASALLGRGLGPETPIVIISRQQCRPRPFSACRAVCGRSDRSARRTILARAGRLSAAAVRGRDGASENGLCGRRRGLRRGARAAVSRRRRKGRRAQRIGPRDDVRPTCCRATRALMSTRPMRRLARTPWQKSSSPRDRPRARREC